MSEEPVEIDLGEDKKPVLDRKKLAAAALQSTQQRRDEVVKAYLNRPLAVSRAAWMRSIGLDKHMFYTWMTIPEFKQSIEWADEQRRAIKLEPLDTSMQEIVGVLVDKAKDGDIRAIEICLQLDRLLVTGGAQQSVSVNLVNRGEDKPDTVEASFEIIEEKYAQAREWKRLREIEDAGLGD